MNTSTRVIRNLQESSPDVATLWQRTLTHLCVHSEHRPSKPKSIIADHRRSRCSLANRAASCATMPDRGAVFRPPWQSVAIGFRSRARRRPALEWDDCSVQTTSRPHSTFSNPVRCARAARRLQRLARRRSLKLLSQTSKGSVLVATQDGDLK